MTFVAVKNKLTYSCKQYDYEKNNYSAAIGNDGHFDQYFML